MHGSSSSDIVFNNSTAAVIDQIASEIPTQLVWPILAIGLLCVLIAALGICGICGKRQVLGRCAIYTYGAIVIIAIIAEVALGSALFAWNSGADVGDLQHEEAQLMHRVATQVYPLCCNNETHVLIPQPPPQGEPSCPIPAAKEILVNSDCASVTSLSDGLDRVLRHFVVPVAAATLGLAAVELLALIGICCIASAGRKQAAKAEEAARNGESIDGTTLWLVAPALYGESSGNDGRSYAVATSTPSYTRF